ncbi:MAG: transglycosylase [Brevundimonas sp.]|nr:transglycosylase [Brevundimonas sp.]
MSFFRRAMIAPTLAALLAAVASGGMATGAQAAEAGADVASADAGVDNNEPKALSSADRLSYTTAFDALRRGDLELARTSARQANDRVLLGQVEFERLFHPDHVANYDELAAWLEDYSDLSCAPRVYTLALRRRPDGAAEPKRPAGVGGRTWQTVVAAGGGSTEDDPAKAARVMFNRDDLNNAYVTGVQIGDWWTAGLAAYRMADYARAFQAFERVAADPTEDPWVRAGAGVWTSKAAALLGRRDQVQPFLQLAAQWPATFYGQIALRQLGQEPEIQNQGPRAYYAAARGGGGYQQAAWAETSGVDNRELNAFIQSDPQARRTVAFYEVGRRTDARDELTTGLRTAVGETARRMWLGLARSLGPRVMSDDTSVRSIDASRFATPELLPEGGFTIERSLVYALARKETDFNPSARSSAGAYGMMQVMPGTAAEMTGDRDFVAHPNRLLDPAVNLRLGQTYVNRMLARPEFQGDLLRAEASYNAGPGPMLAALRKLGPTPDPLLLIETIDVPQARDYVEKVVAAYWIYQRMFGLPLNTLDAVASGAGLAPMSLDYTPPPPVPAVPVEMAAAPADGLRF